MPISQKSKKIVILGAGFGGLFALRSIYRHVKNWRELGLSIIDKITSL